MGIAAAGRPISWHSWGVNTLTSAPLLGFDTETTGVKVGEDRIVTAAIVSARDGEREVTTWLINPGIEIPEAAEKIHGVTTQMARDKGREPAEALEEIAAALARGFEDGGAIVAFNASFDLAVLDAELARHELPSMRERLGRGWSPIVDPLVIDRGVDRYRRGKRTLGHLCEHYGVEANAFHSADDDVTATLDLLHAMVAAHPKLGELSLQELHEQQERWHRAWAENFEEFLRSKGRSDATLSREWPVEVKP